MSTLSVDQIFENIYSTDLVFQKDCWKLCGDAHCCNFNRYKPENQKVFQEIPLLPGEFKFLEKKGYLTQYPEYSLNVFEVELSIGTLKI